MPLPARVGPFRIDGLLGEGGMGVVYRGTTDAGAEAAVKVLRGALASTDLVRRFEREARVRVDHPNVVRILDAGADEQGTPWIAFERLRGESLADRLERGVLAPSATVDVGVQALRGLEAAHAAGVVHRDLKPSNLFLCEGGAVKLLDFGIALLEADHTRLTRTGGVPGTIGYLSPEQAEGRVDVGPRSDLWSLGAVLYECLAGMPPFQQPSPIATIVATLMADLIPVTSRAPRTPPALATVVERALARDPASRWPDAASMREALEQADLAVAPAAQPQAAPLTIPPGERRVVAVVLADGVRSPERVADAITRRGGVAQQMLGQRVLGLFGGATWVGDEITRAAEAAADARPFAERVAVASGWATSEGDRIAGDALTAAERACAAGLGGVAVHQDAARALRDSMTLTAAGDGLWELDREGGLRAPRGADEVTAVGRRSEIAQLEAALRTVLVDGRALAALVVGPVGIGKSRLREELEARVEAAAPAATRAVATATPRDRDIGFGVVRSLVASLVAKDGTPDRRALEEVVGDAVGRDPDASLHVAALTELLGLDRATRGAASTDLARVADRIHAAVRALFAGLAERGPVVVAVEDLQWADPKSLDLLETVLDDLRDAPLLLLVTTRPELFDEHADLFAGSETVRVEPRGLDRDEVGELARALTGRALPEPLVRAIADRTAGNPFFVIQIVRALEEEGGLDADPEALPLPPTVEAAVQSRFDHLQPGERELVKRLAVWGRPASLEELAALGAEGAADRVVVLARRDLVSVHGPRGRRTYQLRGRLAAQVARRMIVDDVRRELHRAAAAHLDASPASDPEELGDHYRAADEPAPAARAYATAARLAIRRGDTATALRCSDAALELGVDPETRFSLHVLRIDALRFLGRHDEQGVEVDRAASHATGDAQVARAESERSVWLLRAGRSIEALEAAERSAEAARRSGDREATTMAQGRRLLALVQVGRLDEAREALGEATRHLPPDDPALRAMVTAWRAHLASVAGDLGERIAAFRELVGLYAELGDRRRAAGAEANLADAYNRVGAWSDAEAALRAAIDGCRRVGHRTMEGYAWLNLGYSLARLGRTDEALGALDEAAAVASDAGEARLGALVSLYRARALVRGGQADAAAHEAEQVIGLAEGAGMRDLLAGALAVAASALRASDPAAALERSERAWELYRELGGVEEDEAELVLAHARALDANGRAAEAREVRAAGRSRLEHVAAGIADPTLRARFLENVPEHAELTGRGS